LSQYKRRLAEGGSSVVPIPRRSALNERPSERLGVLRPIGNNRKVVGGPLPPKGTTRDIGLRPTVRPCGDRLSGPQVVPSTILRAEVALWQARHTPG